MTTVDESISKFLHSVSISRSKNTFRTYSFALQSFSEMLSLKNNTAEMKISELREDYVADFAEYLKSYSPATEQLYLQTIMVFFEFISASEISSPNLPRIKMLIRQRSRKSGKRLPQFPKSSIEQILDSINQAVLELNTPQIDEFNEASMEILRIYRDRAFLFVLADTGLRVHEACGLRRGDLDWNEGHAIIIGKGNKQALVRFSTQSMRYLKEYITMRKVLDGNGSRPLGSLPIFARHDKGAGKIIKPISRMTGWNIVSEWANKSLGETHEEVITPHSFRHYFVTTVLRASGNLKLAQELARHANITVTQRYVHLSDDELDRGYHQIFNEKDQINSNDSDS